MVVEEEEEEKKLSIIVEMDRGVGIKTDFFLNKNFVGN